MDYLTKPTNRQQLRELSIVFRNLFGLNKSCKVPVIEMLDKLPDAFPGSSYIIVEDSQLPKNVPAQCVPTGENTFEIQIKNSVYKGAHEKEIGGYRAHIVHEMCHVFLYLIGFRPVMQRSFLNGELPPYKSVEWQAKALCGEIMMPFDKTESLSAFQIMKIYGVSENQAKYRKKYN